MAYVISLGRSGIELVGIEKNTVHFYKQYDFRQPEDLKSEENFKSLIDELKESHPVLKDEAIYLLLHAGCGLQYKVFTVTQDALMISGSATTKEQQAEALLDACTQKVPLGLTGTFTPAVLSDYLQENDYVVSCVFLYQSMLDNIINAFNASGLNLFDVSPFSYGLYKSLDTEKFAQIIIDLPEEMLLVNNIGIVGWTKPEVFNSQLVSAFLVGEAHRHYGIDNSVVETTLVKDSTLERYTFDGLVNKTDSKSPAIFAAYGLLCGGNVKKEGGIKDAVARLRLLFDKGKEEPGGL